MGGQQGRAEAGRQSGSRDGVSGEFLAWRDRIPESIYFHSWLLGLYRGPGRSVKRAGCWWITPGSVHHETEGRDINTGRMDERGLILTGPWIHPVSASSTFSWCPWIILNFFCPDLHPNGFLSHVSLQLNHFKCSFGSINYLNLEAEYSGENMDDEDVHAVCAGKSN